MMKIQNSKAYLSITLSSQQLWCLTKLFGPGLIFGIENPYEDLSGEEIEVNESQALVDLEKGGLIKLLNANQIQVDEMLGGMVYSSIHSDDLLVVKKPDGKADRFYHFLPQWQLELYKSGDEYSLTLFKDRSYLFSHIIAIYNLELKGKSEGEKFSIGARDLEMAAFLFESGKEQSALKIIEEKPSDIPRASEFLKAYIKPDFHLIFDMLYEKNDEKRIHTVKNELLQLNGSLYWVSHDVAWEGMLETLNFTPLDMEKAERRFNMMLPMGS